MAVGARHLRPFHPSNCIKIRHLRAEFDSKLADSVAQECRDGLHYTSRGFTCRVTIEFLESFSESYWSVGFIQCSNRISLRSYYENFGYTSMILHPFGYGRTINDAAIDESIPFCDSTGPKCDIKPGYIPNITVHLQMLDSPTAYVPWIMHTYNVPLSLTERHESFNVSLATICWGHHRCINRTHPGFQNGIDQIFILKTIKWEIHLRYEVDIRRPLGQRVFNWTDYSPDPQVLPVPQRVPLSSLMAPRINESQMIVFHPDSQVFDMRKPEWTGGFMIPHIMLLIKPTQIIVPWRDFLEDISLGYPVLNHYKKHDCVFVKTEAEDVLLPYQDDHLIMLPVNVNSHNNVDNMEEDEV